MEKVQDLTWKCRDVAQAGDDVRCKSCLSSASLRSHIARIMEHSRVYGAVVSATLSKVFCFVALFGIKTAAMEQR